jgi:hypothetical protein
MMVTYTVDNDNDSDKGVATSKLKERTESDLQAG